MGGKYTHEQIKEIDDYAFERGIEVIPCVQCFKHSKYIQKYEKYKGAFLDGYIIGDDSVFELLKRYFMTCKRLFRTNRIHIGADETFDLGRKEYIQKYGFAEQGEIYMRHLRKVIALVDECGMECEMWGDMLKEMTRKFRNGDKDCTKNYLEDFPQNIRVIEWFYGGNYDDKELENIFGCYKGVSELAYCDAITTYPEYHPHNAVGLHTYEMHAKHIKNHNISTYLVSIWNDYQACSLFSCLPALFVCSVYVHGEKLNEEMKEEFEKLVGIRFDDFMLLDLMNRDDDWPRVFIKDWLEESVFKQADIQDVDGANAEFAEYADKLKKVDGKEFSLIFDSMQKFAEMMSIKAELGKTIFTAYKNGEKEVLSDCVKDLAKFIERLDSFIESFNCRYVDEYLTGNDEFAANARLGGVRQNSVFCKQVLQKYLSGDLSSIEILDEQVNGAM